MDDRRNIVLVTADSLRADHCGHLGGENLTPNLDRLAADGVAFETAMANAGATRASMSSFLTGRYPHARPTASSVRDLVGQHFAAENTLPERLSRRGYETAVFTANPWTSRYFLDEDLFDHFVDFMDEDGDTPSETTGDVGTTVERGGTLNRMVNWWQGQDMFMTWEAMIDHIEMWLADASEPYFCWVFVVDPHMPYLPPAAHRTQSQLLVYAANAWLYADRPGPFDSFFSDVLAEAYRNTVRYTDEFVGRLSEQLTEDTVFGFHADHGEVFGEDGMYGHGNAHEKTLRVPLVLANAGRGSDRVTEPFSLCSLPDLLVDAATATEFDPRDHTEPYVTARLAGPERVVRGPDWKYVRRVDGEQTYRVRGGTQVEADLDDLRATCSALADAWDRSTADRREVMAAAADLVESERL